MTAEMQALRRDHNPSPDSPIASVAHALGRHMPQAWTVTLSPLPAGSVGFGDVPEVDPADSRLTII